MAFRRLGENNRRARSPNAVQAGEELNKNRSSRDQTQEKSKMRRQIIVITEKMEDKSQFCRPATTARAAGNGARVVQRGAHR